MDKDIENLVRENNELLRKMHRSHIRGRFYRVAYWSVVILFALGAFYFVQPYVEQIHHMYSEISGADGSENSLPSFFDILNP